MAQDIDCFTKEAYKNALTHVQTSPQDAIVTAACHWHKLIDGLENHRIVAVDIDFNGNYTMPEKGRGMLIVGYREQSQAMPTYAVVRMQQTGDLLETLRFQSAFSVCGQAQDINLVFHALVRRPRTEKTQSDLKINSGNLKVVYEPCSGDVNYSNK